MSKEEDQQARAEEIRRQIEELKKGPAKPGPVEKQPGESDKEYLDRRSRELSRKKPPSN